MIARFPNATAQSVEVHTQRIPPVRPGECLEFALSFPASQSSNARESNCGVLLCSPQPFLGGDLDNNVLRALATAIAGRGRPCLRFNYRSVGASHDVDARESRFDYWRRVEEAKAHDAVHADARRALEWGLVNEVVPNELLREHAHAYAKRLAAMPTAALALTKQAVYRATGVTLADALEHEAQVQQHAAGSDDHVEGVMAFLEKRDPVFTGR